MKQWSSTYHTNLPAMPIDANITVDVLLAGGAPFHVTPDSVYVEDVIFARASIRTRALSRDTGWVAKDVRKGPRA
jgi:hypothetical protein